MIRIEGADERLQLRQFLGFEQVGTVVSARQSTTGLVTATATPVLRRRYATLGNVGSRISLAPAVYVLTVGGVAHPSHLHEARAYEVSITSDVVALDIAYVDRSHVRRRRWLTTSLISVAGGVFCLASMADGIETRGASINRPLMFTGVGIAGTFQFTFMIPLLTRDDARIDVIHRDGWVERDHPRARE